MKLLWKGGSFLFNFFYVIFGLIFIGIATYFFAFNLLREPLAGNDALNALTYASWIKQYFPDVPLWYPLTGGGVSFVLGYPILFPLVVVVLHKLASINLPSSMGVLNFLSVLVPAMNIFLFVFYRFKSRLAALVSGVFFLISPLSYILISDAGFLANSFAAIFAVPLFASLYLFFESIIERRKAVLKLFYLFAAGVSFSIGMLANPTVPIGIFITFSLYSLIYSILRFRINGFSRWLSAILVVGITLFLVSLFATKPLNDYTAFSNRDIGPIPLGDTSTFPPVELRGILGLYGWSQGYEYPFPNLSIVPLVWISALFGFMVALVKRDKKIISLSLVGAFSIFQMGTFTVWNLVQRLSPFLAQFVFNRYFYIPTMILLPILGGLGIVNFINLPFDLILKVVKERKKLKEYLLKPIFGFITTAVIIIILLVAAIYFNPLSGMYSSGQEEILHYGQKSGFNYKFLWNRAYTRDGSIRDYCDASNTGYSELLCENPYLSNYLEVSTFIYYCDIYNLVDSEGRPYYCKGGKVISDTGSRLLNEADIFEFIGRCQNNLYSSPLFDDLCLSLAKTPQEQLKRWPKLFLPSEFDVSNFHTAMFTRPDNLNNFVSQENIRIDVTSSLGSWVKEWAMTNQSSILNAYTGQLILNKSFNSYFRDVAYKDTYSYSDGVLDEIAKYFGTTAIFTADPDKVAKFEENGWIKSEAGGGTLWKAPFETSIYTLEKKPMVLVIGSKVDQAYGQIFRLATLGGLSYEDAILVEGENESLDSYSLAELRDFDLVVLHGYKYKNRTKAYVLLEQYVRGGGSIFIDTGWQYVTPDWGKEAESIEFSVVMPASLTSWGNAGATLSGATLDTLISEDVNLSNFAPLTWQEGLWSLSYANFRDLRVWANPFLQIGDRVIIAGGQLGEGKIVWSGMNLATHVIGSQTADEFKLMQNIFDYLLEGKTSQESDDFYFQRTPDSLKVNFPQGVPDSVSFYFRESYYPYWKAKLTTGAKSQNLTIYQAGPRFMLVKLPETALNSRLEISFSPGASLIIPKVISFGTFFILLVLLLDALFAKGKIGKSLKNTVLAPFLKLTTGRISNKYQSIKKDLSEEEDY